MKGTVGRLQLLCNQVFNVRRTHAIIQFHLEIIREEKIEWNGHYNNCNFRRKKTCSCSKNRKKSSSCKFISFPPFLWISSQWKNVDPTNERVISLSEWYGYVFANVGTNSRSSTSGNDHTDQGTLKRKRNRYVTNEIFWQSEHINGQSLSFYIYFSSNVNIYWNYPIQGFKLMLRDSSYNHLARASIKTSA